jgi:multidrug efflux pump subunit AcrA (membrane-fusion protein)
VRFALGLLPGFLGIGFFFLLVANAAIAQAILVRFGMNIRPTPAMSALALPGWFATAAAIAAIGAMFPGAAGVAGTSLAMICALGFAFSGLAVVHALVLNSGARGVLLAVAYAAIFLFAPAIVLVLLLGIVEPWTRLRERFMVSAPLAGRLARISLREGDTVAAGAVVARLSPVLSPLLDERTVLGQQARVQSAEAAVLRAGVHLAVGFDESAWRALIAQAG